MTAQDLGPASVATEGKARKSDCKIDSEVNVSITTTQAVLIRTIKAHIAAGDKTAQKSSDHYISAGRHLATLKEEHAGNWAEWTTLIKAKVGISTGRASELMQIAGGRKTVYQVRVGKAQSMKRLGAKVSSPRGEETSSAETAGAPESAATAGATDDADGKARKQPAKKKAATAKPKRSTSQYQRELEAKQAHIDDLEAAREHDQDIAEQLQAAKIKIIGLESEVEELKAENKKLREQLEAARAGGSQIRDGDADTYLDPGPIPDCLRRVPKAVTS
jgi:hypothetical protein